MDSILKGKCWFIGGLSLWDGTLFICLCWMGGAKSQLKEVKLGYAAALLFSLLIFVHLKRLLKPNVLLNRTNIFKKFVFILKCE